MSLCDLLSQTWAGPTLAALCGVILSFLAEYLPWSRWPARYKRLAFLVVVAIVAVGAWLLAPAAGCDRPGWDVLVMAVLAAFGAGTVAHTRKL